MNTKTLSPRGVTTTVGGANGMSSSGVTPGTRFAIHYAKDGERWTEYTSTPRDVDLFLAEAKLQGARVDGVFENAGTDARGSLKYARVPPKVRFVG